MKIQPKKTMNRVTFSSLEKGDAFHAVDGDTTVFWMKTTHIVTDEDVFNAVDLFDGEMAEFDSDELVTPVTVIVVEE